MVTNKVGAQLKEIIAMSLEKQLEKTMSNEHLFMLSQELKPTWLHLTIYYFFISHL